MRPPEDLAEAVAAVLATLGVEPVEDVKAATLRGLAHLLTPEEPQKQKLLYSIEDVQERTSLGRSKVYELLAAGTLASVSVGRRRLVSAAALDSFIAGLVDAGGAA